MAARLLASLDFVEAQEQMNGTQLESLLQEILRRIAQDREYLTIDEVAIRLKCNRKTVINRISAGIFREGVHYFRPEGTDKSGKPWHCEPLFKWSAVVKWVEGEQPKPAQSGVIPMHKGYSL